MPAMTFAQWKHLVDAVIVKRCGLTSDDLPDYGYADAYRAGVRPAAAAAKAIRAARDF